MRSFNFTSKAKRAHEIRGQRGIALLVVLTMVVMFTAFVVDFSYSSRLRYTMAVNARDAARAEALARSGIRIYTLLLLWGDTSQKKMAGSTNPMMQQISAFLGNGSMVVRLIPVLDTGLLRMLFGGGGTPVGGPEEGPVGEDAAPEPMDAPVSAPGSFLDFEGDFSVAVKEEATKISLNAMGKAVLDPNKPVYSAQLLLQSLKREDLQPLFREANITPEELISNIIDWADENSERANGQGYEDSLYNNLADPYNVKSSGFDSISELHLVAGMTDEFFNVVAPLVTVATDKDTISLPINDPNMMAAVIQTAMGRTFTQADIDHLWASYQAEVGLTGVTPLSAQDLVSILQKISPALSSLTVDKMPFISSDQKNRPTLYTMTATGRAGEVERTVELILDTSGKSDQGKDVVYYWRVE